jgi:hypothetical protein
MARYKRSPSNPWGIRFACRGIPMDGGDSVETLRLTRGSASARLDRLPITSFSPPIHVAVGVHLLLRIGDINSFSFAAPAIRIGWHLSLTALKPTPLSVILKPLPSVSPQCQAELDRGHDNLDPRCPKRLASVVNATVGTAVYVALLELPSRRFAATIRPSYPATGVSGGPPPRAASPAA